MPTPGECILAGTLLGTLSAIIIAPVVGFTMVMIGKCAGGSSQDLKEAEKVALKTGGICIGAGAFMGYLAGRSLPVKD